MPNSQTPGDGAEGAGTKISAVWQLNAAELLIEELRPKGGLWAGRAPSEHWIYRGQRDSDWGLLPSAFRSDAWKPFVHPSVPPVQNRALEFARLRDFFKGLDRSGLDIPNGIFLPPHFDSGPAGLLHFPLDPAVLIFVALAQHQGLPTRLLDWTRMGLNAAYFAAEGAAKHAWEKPSEVQPKSLAVWAFRSDFADWCEEHIPIQRRSQMINVVTVPRGSNPNLHAQYGAFTESSESHPIEQTIATLEAILSDVGKPFQVPHPLVRYELPCTEAPKLLRLLAAEQIDGARMFPGRDGVVRAMKERSLWDSEG